MNGAFEIRFREKPLHVASARTGERRSNNRINASIPFDGDLAAFHLALLSLPRQRHIVDTAGANNAMGRVIRMLPRLLQGGSVDLELTDRSMGNRFAELAAEVREIQFAGAVPPTRQRDERPRTEQELHALASTVELTTSATSAHFTLRSEQRTRLNETELTALLERRPSLGAILTSRDGAATGHDLTLREIYGASCGPRQQVYTDDLVLPDSYRDPYSDRSPSRVIQHWSRVAAHLSDEEPATPVPGTWYHLDNQHQGHFGHALTEQLSRTWAWKITADRYPDVRGFVFGNHIPSWQSDLFEAAGIHRDRIEVFSSAIAPERLITASPMYVIGSHVDPAMAPMYDHVGDALIRSQDAVQAPRRLFLTRDNARRSIRNLDQVHEIAQSFGFELIRPETHTLGEQAHLARSADVIAGIAGSNMFSIAFATNKPVLAVTNESYHAHNETQLSQLRGHNLTILRAPSEVTASRFRPGIMHSASTVDLARLSRDFQAVLD